MLKHITLKLIGTLLAIVATSPAVAFGPGEAAGGRRPAPTIKAFPKGTDFVVLVWYRRDDPLGTFEHQFYDVRKGEYTSGVDDWLRLMRTKYADYLVVVRPVNLSRERGETEKLKVGSVIHRELMIAAARSGVVVGAPITISPGPYAGQAPSSRVNRMPTVGGGDRSYLNAPAPRSRFPCRIRGLIRDGLPRLLVTAYRRSRQKEMSDMRTWIIGSAADCDLVVTRPTVSGRHCRLTEIPTASSSRIWGRRTGRTSMACGSRRRRASRATDTITLGLTILMPWPVVDRAPGVTVIGIGRSADNKIVLDDPRVSGHHARLLVVPGSKTLVEDLGSSNGTFVNSADQRVMQAVPITESDTVYFGSLAVPAARAPDPATQDRDGGPLRRRSRHPSRPSRRRNRVHSRSTPASGSAGTRGFDDRTGIRSSMGDLSAGPCAGPGDPGRPDLRPADRCGDRGGEWGLGRTGHRRDDLRPGSGRDRTGRFPGGVGRRRRSADPPGRGTIEARLLASPGVRIVTLVVLCVLQCAVLLTIVHWGSGLRGDWLAMFGVLVMAAGVGLSLGLAGIRPEPKPRRHRRGLAPEPSADDRAGRMGPAAARTEPAVRPAAAAMPSRWAFEGLLLLEADRRLSPEGTEPNPNRDLSEDVFPAGSERMGVTADAMALGFMLIGLTATAAFISSSWKPSQ